MTPNVTGWASAVDVSSVADAHDEDKQPVVKNLVNDPVVAGPDAVEFLEALELFDTVGTGIRGQAVNLCCDPPLICPRQTR